MNGSFDFLSHKFYKKKKLLNFCKIRLLQYFFFAFSENKSLKALLCKPDSGTLPTWQKPEKVDNKSWKAHLCSLLTKKACLVYSVLIEKEIDNAQ